MTYTSWINDTVLQSQGGNSVAWLLDRECGCASVTVLLLLRWGSDRVVWILAPVENIVWVSIMVRSKIYGYCMLGMVRVKLSF
jgi:hypothetical protein